MDNWYTNESMDSNRWDSVYPEYVNEEYGPTHKNIIRNTNSSTLEVIEHRKPGHKESEAGVYDSLYQIDINSSQKVSHSTGMNAILNDESFEKEAREKGWSTCLERKKLIILILCILLIGGVIVGVGMMSIKGNEMTEFLSEAKLHKQPISIIMKTCSF